MFRHVPSNEKDATVKHWHMPCQSRRCVMGIHFGAFAKLLEVSNTLSYLSIRPSVCPHGKPRLPVNEYSWNFVLTIFLTQTCQQNASLTKTIRQLAVYVVSARNTAQPVRSKKLRSKHNVASYRNDLHAGYSREEEGNPKTPPSSRWGGGRGEWDFLSGCRLESNHC